MKSLYIAKELKGTDGAAASASDSLAADQLLLKSC